MLKKLFLSGKDAVIIMAEKEKTNRGLSILDMTYIGLSTALIAVCSWISIPLTVPITLQTLGICMISGIFGMKRGTISVLVYIALGAIGIPVFSGFKGGIGVLLSSTGGYIVGFIFTALLVGYVSDKTKGRLWCIILAMVCGVLIVYAFGTAWFAVVYAKTSGGASLATILGWCVLPFLLPDAVKICLSAILANRLRRFVK